MSMELHAPAKLNLMLHITARREDGYHEIQSLCQLIDWADALTLEARSDREVVYADDTQGRLEVEENLCVRAARLAMACHPEGCGVEMFLNKRIPWGGGLGGGSSDAAAILHGLNRLWGEPWEHSELAELGVRLGADVPLFVRGTPAWMEGIGEKLTPAPFISGVAVVLPPPIPINTAQAYQAVELTQWSAPITMDIAETHLGSNVFEQSLCKRYPEIAARLARLREYAPAGVTGSGGAVFAWCADRAQAERVLAQCPEEWDGRMAASLERSPVLDPSGT